MDSAHGSQEFKGTGYELFIVSISTLAIANLFIIWFTPNTDMDQVISIINIVLSIFLLVDFFIAFSPQQASKNTFSGISVGWISSAVSQSSGCSYSAFFAQSASFAC